jgi:hypothetical protein
LIAPELDRPSPRRRIADAVIVCVLAVFATATAWSALRDFRAAGAQPFFYQTNFEPAVLMACGRGFGVVLPTPAALNDFLLVKQDRFDCAALGDLATRPLVGSAHANWYYMYGAAAAVWRVTGVSWRAIDWLVAIMVGAVAAVLYALFRLAGPRWMAALFTVLFVISPANLNVTLSLRDYSKAPFVLGALLVLGWLAMQPRSRRMTWTLAAIYGVVVGIGYGFRADLIVMVPLGAVFVLLFLPGSWRLEWRRNALAAVTLVAAFVVSSWPVLTSAMDLGGCHYHFALLGWTSPLAAEMRLTPADYRFGDHLTDTFADLKVADYASRMLGMEAPLLCDANYDRASGQLYSALVRTFPADIVVRAYGSVLAILRVGLAIPEMMQPMRPFPSSELAGSIYRGLAALTTPVAAVGPLLVLAAAALAWARSARLGLAFSAIVLLLGGYPAIQFEARHWFHLRILPWWALAVAFTAVVSMRGARPDFRALARGVMGVGALIVAMALALAVIRFVQGRQAGALIASYEAAATEPVVVGAAVGGFVPVTWQGADRGSVSQRRSSELLVVSLSTDACAGDGPLVVTARYTADVPTHDITTAIDVPRPEPGRAPTRLFIPIFKAGSPDQIFLEFIGLHVAGAPPACIASVARATGAEKLPLWLQVIDRDPASRSLHESMWLPRVLRR